METLEIFVARMARKCPRLADVAIAGLRGYAIAGDYLRFRVERGDKSIDDAESEQEIVIEGDIRMYK